MPVLLLLLLLSLLPLATALDIRLLLSLESEDRNSATSLEPASLVAAVPPLNAFLSAKWLLLAQSFRGVKALDLTGLLPLDRSCRGVEPGFGPAATCLSEPCLGVPGLLRTALS